MTDPHGTPIWYELLTGDPDASAADKASDPHGARFGVVGPGTPGEPA